MKCSFKLQLDTTTLLRELLKYKKKKTGTWNVGEDEEQLERSYVASEMQSVTAILETSW